ncbi:hypothetical protein [Rhodococcus sp. NPDC058521]|uniref:hypothetical protein n=1 Tax=Rhodococcus sp. NPDC058521 TaxID=3346536 RepID=UPI003649C68B
MTKVILTTKLSIPATTACALAQKPELFKYVVWPIIRVPHLTLPEHVEPGTEGSARIWWFGIIPAWKHHLKLIRLEPTEIYTNEWGGPVHTWNHHLTFTPIDEHSCTYTDEIEFEDGVAGYPTWLFIHLMFRYRQRRWRALARVLA